MHAKQYTDVSIKLSRLLLEATGSWTTVTNADEYRRRFAMFYTAVIMIYGIFLNVVDIYHSLDDLSHCVFLTCNTLCIVQAMFKLTILNILRREFSDIISYAQQNFWHMNYDQNEKQLFVECGRICKFMVLSICSCAQASLAFYIITPICANIGRNKSDWALPFAMWVDLPLNVSPYYEIMFFIQILTVQQIGIGYICADNFLCMLNLHVVYQFRMLQYRLQSIWSTVGKETDGGDYTNRCYTALKRCIQQHKSLVEYCDKIEHVYTIPILSYMVIFSILMCFDTYEIVLADIPAWSRLIFIFHMGGSYIHIIFFTYSCHGIIEESSNISIATYSGMWTMLPMSETGKMIRQDMMIMMMKTMRPCSLTAGGFFPVSLETSTALFSSTMSYFALMRESSKSSDDSE